MKFFQNSVLNKHLKTQDSAAIKTAYAKFVARFHDPEVQENIRNSKEEQYQGEFLIDLFVNVLGYTKNPAPNFNITTEYKNVKDSKKADGAILINGVVKAVIELKGTETTDLNRIEAQAFGYKNNQPECVYVITSNFEKLRFYIDNAIENIEFNLFTLSEKEFELLWLCLAFVNIEKNLAKRIKDESVSQEDVITKNLYNDYSLFKRELHQNLVILNPDHDPLTLFKKSQKLLDRFLFLFFAEDRQLLPPNSVRLILDDWRELLNRDVEIALYARFKKYFEYLNTGFKGKRYDVFAYNGGLFKTDELLDGLKIDDELLYRHTLKLSEYDFASEVDVNILGHIFENSLNELDEIKAQLEGQQVDKSKSKRKKDGVFYTPKYITKYIVDNTVGKLCMEKKAKIGLIEEEYITDRKRTKKTIQPLFEKLTAYRDWLLQLTICDPACGSGAFLNQALDFLINEHRYIDELQAKLFGDALVLSDFEKNILENNLFGVDLNEESVEIAKLSLWLRTAQPNRKLNDLNNNIKCGNSLIDDPAVAGDKAFNWQAEFPTVFEKGGFDVVIGNPPYGAYLDALSKEYYQSHMSTFQGNFEIYFFFIELLNVLAKHKGKAGYITPDTWINIPQAQKLREHVLSNYGINTIVTFEHSVFDDASVNPILFILGKNAFVEKCKILHIDTKSKELSIESIDAEEALIANWTKSNDKQFQVWQNEIDISIISKISTNAELGSSFLDVCQGIVPYSTENLSKDQVKSRIYHNDTKISDEWGIWIQGRSLNRYGIDISVHEYLKYGEWLHRPRKSKYFNGKRILIQEITGGHPPRITATIYDGTLYHDPGIISCLNITEIGSEYLLAIINSKLISWFNLKTSPKGNRTTFPKILIGDIRKLPIKLASKEIIEKVIQKVQKIVTQTNQSQTIISDFTNLFRNKFDIEKPSNNILNWDELDFKDFLNELKKARVQLSLSSEVEWMHYFNEQKQIVLELKSEIDKTDKEIDRMVYELYGLTEEEIGIVEGA